MIMHRSGPTKFCSCMVHHCCRCIPLKLTSGDVAAGVMRDRAHAGSSMADIEPMAIDKTVSVVTVMFSWN